MIQWEFVAFHIPQCCSRCCQLKAEKICKDDGLPVACLDAPERIAPEAREGKGYEPNTRSPGHNAGKAYEPAQFITDTLIFNNVTRERAPRTEVTNRDEGHKKGKGEASIYHSLACNEADLDLLFIRASLR